MIQHVSLDLWGTILKSNPRFKRLRANFIRKIFNLEEDNEFINRTIDNTGELFDKLDTNTGESTSSSERYKGALTNLGMSISYHKAVKDKLDDFFISNLPLLFDNDTHATISRIRRRVKTLTVTSNTGYISGIVMRDALHYMSLASYFDYIIFSDQVGICKPHRGIFDEWALLVSKGKGVVNPKTFLHVGDNKVTDYEGPKKLGMESFLVNGKTGRNIKSVLTFLDGKL